MSRDALVEALAKARHKNWSCDVQEANSWPCEFCRARTEDIVDTDNGWAAIAAFVAAWLTAQRDDPPLATLVTRWREEMAP